MLICSVNSWNVESRQNFFSRQKPNSESCIEWSFYCKNDLHRETFGWWFYRRISRWCPRWSRDEYEKFKIFATKAATNATFRISFYCLGKKFPSILQRSKTLHYLFVKDLQPLRFLSLAPNRGVVRFHSTYW